MNNREFPHSSSTHSTERFWVYLAFIISVVGVVLRASYALSLHDPTEWVVSDAFNYVKQALSFAQGEPPQTAGDAIWPPTTAALLSFSLLIGGDFRLAQFLFLFLSIATIGLTWSFARSFGSRRFAACATIPASLAIAPIHFTGLFLSELPGIASVTLALVFSAYSLSLARGASAFIPGLLTGLSWGLAASIRPQNLIVGTCVIAILGFLQWKRSGARLASMLAISSLLGFSIWLSPFAYRCSTLTGRYCAVSGNSLFNSVIGFSGDVAAVHFSDGTWSPPAKLQHELTGSTVIAASMFDTDGLFKSLVERIQQHPLDACVAFLGNGLDLFRDYIWLTGNSPVPRRYYIVGQQLFLFLVIIPAVASLRIHRSGKRPEGSSQARFLLLATFVVVFLVHAISLGESRYRLPYDGILYVLAAAFYTGDTPVLRERHAIRGAPMLLVMFVALLIILSGLASPNNLISMALSRLRTPHHEVLPENQILQSCAKTLPGNGSRWDAPEHIVVRRDHVINIQLPTVATSPQVSASFDWNDTYGVIFKRGGVAVGERFIVGNKPGELGGMSRIDLPVPPTAAVKGFDSLSIRLIAGYGRASFGGLLCP